MEEVLLESLVHIAIVLPFLVYFTSKARKETFLIGLLVIFFVFNQLLLNLPFHFEKLDFITSKWNWSGKTYAVIFSIFFYWSISKLIRKDFIKWKWQEGSTRKVAPVVLAFVALTVVIAAFSSGGSNPDTETFFYQATGPGIEEEFAFRGIMLSLLISLNKLEPSQREPIKNPAIYIVAILFALVHSLDVGMWNINMNWFSFLYTFIFGVAAGWVTLVSKSLLFPIALHNLINFSSVLVKGLK